MPDNDWLAERFEANRARLQAVAYRMLGSAPEADDAVQEAWLRLSRSDHEGVDNLDAWLTTVVARLCLDVLRSRRTRREEPLRSEMAEAGPGIAPGPEQELLMAESIGPALLVVLDSLAPAERLAFVLHDMFGMPFDEIGPIVGRSPVATRQLASRARRRVQGTGTEAGDHDGRTTTPAAPSDAGGPGRPAQQREIVAAFLAASRDGDFEALVRLLGPDVVLHADRVSVESATANQARGAPALAGVTRGAEAVAATFSGRARGVRLALVDGGYGGVFSIGGQPRFVFGFSIVGDRVVEMEIISDPATLARLEITAVDG